VTSTSFSSLLASLRPTCGVSFEESANRHRQLRQRGVLWSLAVGANLKQCVRELSKLYTRALRSQPKIVGIAGENGAGGTSPRLAIAAFIWWIARTWGRTPMPQENARQHEFRELELGSADVLGADC